MATETKTEDAKPTVETTPPAAPAKPPTEEELEFQRQSLLHAMDWGDAPKPLEPPADTDEQKKTREEKEKADKAKTEKAPPKPPAKKPGAAATRSALKKPPQPVQAAEDDDDRINAAAERAATKTAEKLKPAPPAATAEPAIDAKDKRMLEVMAYMGKDNAVYKDLAVQFKTFLGKVSDYAQRWEKDNSGRVFDPEAEEHKDWYAANQPDYDEDAFDDARIQMVADRIADKKVAEQTGKTTAELDRLKNERRMEREMPEIASITQNSRLELVKQAIPELAKLLAGESDLKLDDATLDKLENEDPVAMQILNETGDRLGLLVSELERLTRYGGTYKANREAAVKLQTTGEQVWPHAELIDFAGALEAGLAELSPEEATRDGKVFITQEGLSHRRQRVMESDKSPGEKGAALKALNGRYWTLTGEIIRNSLVAEYAERAGKRIKDLNDLADLRMKKRSPHPGAVTTATTTEKPGVVRERTNPPSTAGASAQTDSNSAKPLTDEERLAAVRAIY